jgi:hypothetical protein
VIESETGRVHRTRVRFQEGAVSAELTTDYVREAKLGLWVPLEFNEYYETHANAREEIRCRAVYSNYRRFEVTARIK